MNLMWCAILDLRVKESSTWYLFVCVSLVSILTLRCNSVSNHTLSSSSHLNSFQEYCFVVHIMGPAKTTGRKDISVHLHVRSNILIFCLIQYTGCITWKERFFIKRSEVHLDITTIVKLYLYCDIHWPSCHMSLQDISCLLWKVLWIWLIFNWCMLD